MNIFTKGDYVRKLDGLVEGEVSETFAFEGRQCILINESDFPYDSDEFELIS